jgi:hypothetical protein
VGGCVDMVCKGLGVKAVRWTIQALKLLVKVAAGNPYACKERRKPPSLLSEGSFKCFRGCGGLARSCQLFYEEKSCKPLLRPMYVMSAFQGIKPCQMCPRMDACETAVLGQTVSPLCRTL